ncbi:YheC/YheD family endospore coat-associated protein [Aquibacillus kalidii]|uniref:YheC/YheD family endospore coat-associated protein n=1 Tax=Aquibacillus kalidii TaxID=2762597 RepID=UPI001645D861|nr:YheC/YheD family protein [Aquibacillus kalidii]
MIVPHQVFQQLHKVKYIQYGPNQSPVECLGHHKDTKTLFISSKLKSTINLATHKSLTIHIHDNTCRIPLTLGVFIAGFDSENELLGPRTSLYEKMSQAGNKMGFQTVFFGHQHIFSNSKEIYAYYYNKNKWQRKSLPIPTVIYNRIPNRKIEHHPNVIEAKKILNKQATLFNQNFFNKWEIYERLMKNPDCSYLLPKTILHPSYKKIATLVEQHGLYIKPIHGSRGEGIVKCSKLDTGELECHYYIKEKPQVNRYINIDAFFTQHFPNGLKGYVAQEEIPLLKKRNSAIDFRVHVNKNDRNNWEVTIICAKFAGKGSLTTHVQRGGSLHLVDELFSKEETKRITNKLSTTAVDLSYKLEQALEENVGEIGYDFGIDQEGKIWLFEANSKPGFSIYHHPGIEKLANHVLSYPFQYAFYLHNLRKNKLN